MGGTSPSAMRVTEENHEKWNVNDFWWFKCFFTPFLSFLFERREHLNFTANT